MSDFKQFMKGNKKRKKDLQVAVTESLTDQNGKPVLWTLRHLTAREVADLRNACTRMEQVTGRPDLEKEVVDTDKFSELLITAAVKVPNLRDKELQDSYSASSPMDLIYAMVDEPGEYSRLNELIMKMNGLDESLDDKVAEAKNSSRGKAPTRKQG